MLTLTPAFEGTDRADLLRRISLEEAVPLRKRDSAIPVDLETIVLKATAKNPADRYGTARELADDLQRFLDHQPINARRETVRQRIAKWAFRHTALVWSAAAMLLVSTIALTASTVLILSAYQRENAAHLSESEARRAEQASLARATENLRQTQRQREIAEQQRELAEHQKALAQRSALEARQAAYVSDMRFAFRQYNQGLLHDTRTLLQAQIAEGGLEDLRGLEWHALNAQIESRYQTIGRHEGVVADIDFFPDGHTFATAGEDGAVRVWDADSLSLLREFRLQDKPVYTVGVSPDGQWLAYGAGSRDNPALKPVTLLDARTGVVLGTTNLHDTTIRQVRFSPDGRFLASGSLQEKVSIWEFTDGVRGRSYDLTQPYRLAENFVIQFLDDRQLLTEFHERTGYRVWDVATGDPVDDYLDLSDGNVETASWCAQQSVLAFSEKNYRIVHIIDTHSGRKVGKFKAGQLITSLEFSPHGDAMCVGTESGQIKSVKLSFHGEGPTRRVQVDSHDTLQIHHGTVSRLRFLDERRVISGGVDGRVVVFRLGATSHRQGPFGGYERGVVTQMAASPRNDLMAWSGMDGGVRLADRTTGRLLVETQPLSGPTLELAWSGDGTHLAAISESGRFGCWRVEDDCLVECLRGQVQDFALMAGLALSREGDTLYIGGDRGPDGIHVWDVRTQAQVGFVPTLYAVRRLLVSPDDRLLIAAGEGIFVFDRQTNSQQQYLQTGGVCRSLCFAPDGQTLAAGYEDGVVRLWDPEQGILLRVLPEYDRNDHRTRALLLSNDGRTLTAGDIGGRLRFWNTQTWDYLGAMSIARNPILTISQTPKGDAIDLTLGALGSDLLPYRRFSRISLKAGGDLDDLNAASGHATVARSEDIGRPPFTPHTISTSAERAVGVFAADMDGDGDLDVLSASSDDDKIAWYENDGRQNFTERPISTTADGAYSVFAADVDGDGDLDVLSASYFDDKIAWYENDGRQNFAERPISTTANGAQCVYAADIDGDGDRDVLSASYNDDKIAWYENDGGQNFAERPISTTANGAHSVYATDMDRDGDVDVLSASREDDKIAWYENNGSQSFTEHPISQSADGAQSAVAADMDGDGDLDVLAASRFEDTVAWYENDGRQNFAQRTISTTPKGVYCVFAADVDGDGDLDVLSACRRINKIAWYENVGRRNRNPQTVGATAGRSPTANPADVDGP